MFYFIWLNYKIKDFIFKTVTVLHISFLELAKNISFVFLALAYVLAKTNVLFVRRRF